jgi:hypothetical protein
VVSAADNFLGGIVQGQGEGTRTWVGDVVAVGERELVGGVAAKDVQWHSGEGCD